MTDRLTLANRVKGDDGGPPPYLDVSSPFISSPWPTAADEKHEKQSESAPSPPPQRPSLWTRFRNFFRKPQRARCQHPLPGPASKPSNQILQQNHHTHSPLRLPPIRPPSAAAAAPPTPCPPPHRWRPPQVDCSLQPGRVPLPSRFKYRLSGLFLDSGRTGREREPPQGLVVPPRCPPGSGPWYASLDLHLDDLAAQLPRRYPWRAHVGRRWSDRIEVKRVPVGGGERRLFARTVKVGYLREWSWCMEWAVALTVWHADPQWLANLTPTHMTNLVNLDTLFHVAGFVLPVDEPLVSYKQFYAHYYVIPKIGERTAKYVDKQNKKLGRLVDEHFTWYIRWPTDQELTQAMVEDNEAAGTREVCTHMFLDSI